MERASSALRCWIRPRARSIRSIWLASVRAHQLDVRGEVLDLERAVLGDLEVEVARGDLAGLGDQPGHRREHLAAQPAPEHDAR